MNGDLNKLTFEYVCDRETGFPYGVDEESLKKLAEKHEIGFVGKLVLENNVDGVSIGTIYYR